MLVQQLTPLDWESLFPTSSELVEYYKTFANHYALPESTLFGQNVERATWHEERSLWVLIVKDLATGQEVTWTAKVLVQAAGTYNRKSIPMIPGIETFEGDSWHTVDWPSTYDFAGKTVAYVGTGPTSVQVLPYLQQHAASVKVFCRSMTYCHPFNNFRYPKPIKWAFRWIPGLLAVYSYIVALLFGLWAWFAFRPESYVAKFTEYYCRRKLKMEVSDPLLQRKLEPSGRFGAKRPLVSLEGYFEVLQKDNVEVSKCPIIAINATGINTNSNNWASDSGIETCGLPNGRSAAMEDTKHIEADVLIWGTGFQMQGWGSAVPTIGRTGILLSEHWEEGPKTLHGECRSISFTLSRGKH
jgi:cation diffusion facilitator CzcD-associated flavoprotein CzcO